MSQHSDIWQLKSSSSLLDSIMGLISKSNQQHLFQWILASLSLLTLYRWSYYSILYSTLGAIIFAFIFHQWHEFLYVFIMTVPRDLVSLIRYLRIHFFLYRMKWKNYSVPKIFQKVCQRHPRKILFYFQDEQWTFKQVDKFSNQIANYFISQGFKKGDEVALFMDNRPEYVAIWLGLAKAGIISALVNNNQRKESLIHSLTVVDCKAMIFCSDLFQAVDEVRETLNSKNPQFKYFCFGSSGNVGDEDNSSSLFYQKLDKEMENSDTNPPQKIIDSTSFNDRLLYIYTSGTEGLPKAAIIKNSRFLYMGAGVKYMLNLKRNDVIYTCLPLYHLAAGTVGVCQGLIFGNSMAIRNKFSATNFWKDCAQYKCTVAQYIGEVCRYLLARPESSYDKSHCVRIMFGNGLRASIWKDFVERFNIKQIGELYGSTEGNVNIINVDNKEGSCGFMSRIAPWMYPATLIKVDENTNEPVRNKDGLCVKAQPGETGEFVGKIKMSDPLRAFDGYANKEATQKKMIYDVFRKGDCAFASGDLLIMDQFGYLYFKDRCGDTFRWKGENVSTMELESVISNTVGLADCIVYGVEVPGMEGKAGMAAILDNNRSVDLNDLLQKLRTKLPVYMIPVFVRLVDRLELTSTHKMPKVTYRKQGFNPKIIPDPLFMLDTKNFKYVPLDEDMYQKIVDGKLRF